MGLRFNRDAGVVLAGAIGRSRTQLGVCDLDGGVLATTDLDQEVGAAPDDLMPQVLAGFTDLLKEAGRRVKDVRAVGLSIPGTVEFERGREPRLADHGGLGRRRAGAVPQEARPAPALRSSSTTTPT